MTRTQFEAYVAETYPAIKEYPWTMYPDFAVFRHPGGRKCFAIVMDLHPSKLGLPGDGILSVVNLKCSPLLMDAWLREPGIFPAYHMNKEHWLSVALDGRVPDDQLTLLLDMSYDATLSKRKKARTGR